MAALSQRTYPFILLVLLHCAILQINAQEPIPKGHLRVAFYNAENAFDCRHDSLHDDTSFLPESPRHWSPYRYHQKLQHLGQAIASLSSVDGLPPALIGLAEVENDSVLHDLTRRSPLRAIGYRYVMTHNTPATDARGIDVALLYRPAHFRLISWSEHHAAERDDASVRVRNLLLVTGESLSGDTLDVVVCHWPSKLGGRKHSAARRQMAATATASLVDSLHTVRTHPCVVVMGDMNDTPASTAAKSLCRHHLTNLTHECKGSYRYKGQWEQLDQIFISSTTSLHTTDAEVLRESFLLEKEPLYGGQRPKRTWNGFLYKGGYSDHLPVFFDIEWGGQYTSH